jgi:transposase-like protein
LTLNAKPTSNVPHNFCVRSFEASPKSRTKYDKAFKQRAVELWLTSGKAATVVAAELGIRAQLLSRWRERFAPPPPGGEGGGGAKRRAEQLEADNASLRRENEYLRQQRDILKKTLGILSEAPASALNGLTR